MSTVKAESLSTANPMPEWTQDVVDRQGMTLDQARAALCAKDPVMRVLIDANPNLDHHAWRSTLPVQGLFEALLFQIVGQQISVTAGNAIFARLRTLYSADHNPSILAELSTDELRATGLSTRKAECVKDLARRAKAGELAGLEHLSHEEARTRLISFRGIGPWTADGALFIAFGWDDVLVSGDLVLRKAVQRAYNLPEMPSEREVEAIGEQWRPHRSMAAGYLFEYMQSA
ncbi:DNA-3-methyladenine glycosylase family protein [Spirosoma arcticum]